MGVKANGHNTFKSLAANAEERSMAVSREQRSREAKSFHSVPKYQR